MTNEIISNASEVKEIVLSFEFMQGKKIVEPIVAAFQTNNRMVQVHLGLLVHQPTITVKSARNVD